MLPDMIFYGYHGVLPEETKLGQKFRIAATLNLNVAAAGRTDDLTKSVSYVDIFDLCKNIVEGESCKLIEMLAEKIASAILSHSELIEACTVQVVKENPPIPGYTGVAAVEITRNQLHHVCYLSVGTNIGEREENLAAAIFLISTQPDIRLTNQSSFYETEPIGYTEQDSFLNVVVEIKTALSPMQLLSHCQSIEQKLGRKRTIRWGPRIIDVDILLFDSRSIQTDELTVPHPRMHERSFVMAPLAEINPDIEIPMQQQTAREIAAELPDRETIRKWSKQ